MNKRASFEEDDDEESDDEFDPSDSSEDDDVKKKGLMAKKAAPKRKAPTGRGRGGALKMPTALTGGLSEYEKIRQGNIAEREAMLQDLMADFDSFKKDLGIGAAKKTPPKKRKRLECDSGDEGEFRGTKVRLEGSRKSVRIPEEVMVEGLARSVRAPPPGNKSRATSSGPTVNPPRCRLI